MFYAERLARYILRVQWFRHKAWIPKNSLCGHEGECILIYILFQPHTCGSFISLIDFGKSINISFSVGYRKRLWHSEKFSKGGKAANLTLHLLLKLLSISESKDIIISSWVIGPPSDPMWVDSEVLVNEGQLTSYRIIGRPNTRHHPHTPFSGHGLGCTH